ncbi:MAG TPA: DUF1844 domain-containing protein [Pyrinomonadaceae bacterium]|jgi:hypothetical protein
MGDDQSTFKVTDRRLFNADGTPREIERGAEPAKDATGTPERTEPAKTESTLAEASAATAPAPQVQDREPAPAQPPVGESAAPAEEGEESYDERDLPGANDPASFINFLMSLATNAAAALGMMPHPGTGESGVDLELAKHWIDVLGMLRQKTRGNLASPEDQMFEGILADLRMQYVSLTSGPAQPTKFTGRDITGGR